MLNMKSTLSPQETHTTSEKPQPKHESSTKTNVYTLTANILTSNSLSSTHPKLSAPDISRIDKSILNPEAVRNEAN